MRWQDEVERQGITWPEEDDERLRVVIQLMKPARERRRLEYFRWLAETLV